MVKIAKSIKLKHYDYFQINEYVYFIHRTNLVGKKILQVKTGTISHVTIGDMGEKVMFHIVGNGYAFDKSAGEMFRDYETAFIKAVSERDNS